MDVRIHLEGFEISRQSLDSKAVQYSLPFQPLHMEDMLVPLQTL